MQLVYPFVDKEPNMVLIEGDERRESENYRGETADCV